MQTISFVLARFSEPSSYAGLGALLALAGFHFSDSDLGQLAQFLAAGCGLAALFLKERGMIQMIALALVLGTALGACSGTTTPLPTPQQLVTEGQQAVQDTGAVISVAASAACLAQSVLNIATAASGGGEAGTLSKASAVAGQSCTWSNPTASPAPPVTPTATPAAAT